MKLHVKYDILTLYRSVISEQLDKLGYVYSFESHGLLTIRDPLTSSDQKMINDKLKHYGIQVLDDPREMFVQKIKDVIIELVNSSEIPPSVKFSDYLASKMNHSYGHIAKVFSETANTSIEQFIILQKIEKAKQLLKVGGITLTEIAYQLNYSSVQHLSNQFRKTTGITPSTFQKIMKQRGQTQSG